MRSRRLTPALVALAIAVSGLAFTPAATVHAATFTVNTTADGRDTNPGDGQCRTVADTCSLRAAVQEANAAAGADTITLPAGRFDLNAADTGNFVAGSKALEVAGTVTINGNGAASTVIVAGPSSRVFDIQRFLRDQAFTTNISGVTVTGGTAALGAGVFTGRGVTVSITDSIIDGNVAPGNSSQGGGLFAWGETGFVSSVTLTRVVVIRNSAYYGGGIVNMWPSSMTIIDSQITTNTARGAYAGGVRNTGAMVMTNTVVTNNTAGIGNTSGGPSGGGVYTGDTPRPDLGQTSSFTMSGGSITNNSVPTNLLSNAGGLFNARAGSATLTRVTVSGNTAFTGGGILNDQGTVNLVESTVSGNTAMYGGGIYNNDFAPADPYPAAMTIQRSSVIRNVATENGCPYHLIPPGNLCGGGGGIFSENSDTLVVNSTIAENAAATFAGGIYNLRVDNGMQGQARVRLVHATVSANSAVRDGGGILNNGGTYLVKSSIVADNLVADAANDCQLLAGSVTTSQGNNLVSDTRCGFTLWNDHLSMARLGPLQHNGGPVLTMMPLTGSPAVNTADNATCAAAPTGSMDQRGVARPAAGTCDIGAVEGSAPKVAPRARLYTRGCARVRGCRRR
jgi:CSLREA domain-containing protein